ncbi:PAP2 superfamily protein [Variovorax sp. YR752]|uniref:phosphatase PAP2 family protein n=1 Tax=Variovorax TaxID=34072 RepID=UPI000BDB72EE|nr:MULTISPECIES: phosphatase PAP2 family protein [Variovorax]MDQ0084434.1 membrane-associated phospholipid phosphatase [Variovorax boronicumulans]SOD25745.1 PAP2 superfamily protein [Variovorax sp. YR752]
MTSRPATSSPHPFVPWYVALGQRIATLWVVKMIGTTVGISGFFVVYFWVMHNPPSEPMVMPLTRLDHWVGVSDDAMVLYGSLWFYISLAPAFAKDKAELWACARDAAIMAAVGLVVFWLFPTTVPVFAVDWAQYPALQFLKATDVGGNAFPSLHVAFAVLTAVLLERQLRSVQAPTWLRVLNLLWAFGIVYSTLATRQHVLLDVLGGTLLAAAVSWAGTTRDWLVWTEA